MFYYTGLLFSCKIISTVLYNVALFCTFGFIKLFPQGNFLQSFICWDKMSMSYKMSYVNEKCKTQTMTSSLIHIQCLLIVVIILP